jgi:hypothetical protein
VAAGMAGYLDGASRCSGPSACATQAVTGITKVQPELPQVLDHPLYAPGGTCSSGSVDTTKCSPSMRERGRRRGRGRPIS